MEPNPNCPQCQGTGKIEINDPKHPEATGQNCNVCGDGQTLFVQAPPA